MPTIANCSSSLPFFSSEITKLNSVDKRRHLRKRSPYAKDQRCFSSVHFPLKSPRIEPAHSRHCCPGSEGLPCSDHVSSTHRSSSHWQPSNQGSSLSVSDNFPAKGQMIAQSSEFNYESIFNKGTRVGETLEKKVTEQCLTLHTNAQLCAKCEQAVKSSCSWLTDIWA